MKIALFMNSNSYAGREYLSQLTEFNIDVIIFGQLPEKDKAEDERCGGLWNPVKEKDLKTFFNFYNFDSLESEEFIEFLINKNYDFAIQGGTGILKKNVINSLNHGIINFHPGDLPSFRGCSGPEWQLFERKKIVCTAHYIDEGIDTGNIIKKFILTPDLSTYYSFRASIYPEIACLLKYFIKDLLNQEPYIFKSTEQNENNAIYRNYIGNEKIDILKHRLINEK